jgi:excisionase family DNA binding protein
MRSRDSSPSAPASADDHTGTSDTLEIALRVLFAALAGRPAPSAAQIGGPQPMLTVKQTAALLGMSRMTVIRKADAGELPCIVVSRGTRQKMRRFPRAPIEELAMRGGASVRADLRDYTAQWLASVATRTDCRDA